MTAGTFSAYFGRLRLLCLLVCSTLLLTCGKDDALVLTLRTPAAIKVRSYSLEVMDRKSRRVTYTSGTQTLPAARDLSESPLRIGLKFLSPGEYLFHVIASSSTDLTPPPRGGVADPYYFWADVFNITGEQSIDATLLAVTQDQDQDRDRFPDTSAWLSQNPDASTAYKDKKFLLDCVDRDPDAGDLLPRDVRSYDINPMARVRCGVLYREPLPVASGGGEMGVADLAMRDAGMMSVDMGGGDGGMSSMDGGFTSADGGMVTPGSGEARPLRYIDVTCGDHPQTCIDADGDGDAAETDCDDKDPRRFHGNPRPRNCCQCTDRQSCARNHLKINDTSICNPPRCKTSFDFDCTGRDVDCFVDEDCDGYSPNDPVPSQRDCNDADPNIHPGARKICPGEKGYIKDKDWACDGNPLGGCVDCDLDGDGYQRLDPKKPDGTDGRCPDQSYRDQYQGMTLLVDCDDNDRGVFPESTSTIGPSLVSGVQDGNPAKYGGNVFGALRGLCRNLNASRVPEITDCDMKPRKLCPPANCDLDGDGFPNKNTPDCNPNGFKIDCDDSDPTTFPGAPEQCNNGQNDATVKKTNCDAPIIRRCTTDKDGDGYDAAVDCDDNNPNIYPFASERCDGEDNDCDGLTDEGNPDAQGNALVQYTAVADKKIYILDTDGNLREYVNPPGPNNMPPAPVPTYLTDMNGKKIGPAQALAQGLVTQQLMGCTDYNVGECLNQRIGRCVCTRVDPDPSPFWSKDVKVPLPPRVSCPGVAMRDVPLDTRTPLQLGPKCFGTYQRQQQSCDALSPRDDDCDGRDDDPAGVNLADYDKPCGTDVGECNMGRVIGCDRTKVNKFAQFNTDAIKIVPEKDRHLICAGASIVEPQNELCNGKDDNCDGQLPSDEQDKDNDQYMGCSGCPANCAQGCAVGLKGCNDCIDTDKDVFPGAIDLCDGKDNACKGATWNRATEDGSGKDVCAASAPTCCTFARSPADPLINKPACVNLTRDDGYCGTCQNACALDTNANQCVGGDCKCGNEISCERNPTKPFCLKNGNAAKNFTGCVICRNDGDCKKPGLTKCFNPLNSNATCEECLQTDVSTGTTADCKDAAKPKCNGVNKCVECMPASEATDCKAKNPLKPRCEPSTFTCVQCLPGDTSLDCKVGARLDNVCQMNQCGCTAPGNTCDPANLNGQVCKPNVGCVQCLIDGDCPAAKFPGITKGNPNSATLACDATAGQNKCVQCTNDTHCANNPGQNFACDTVNHVCVQCYKNDTYCATLGLPGKPKCNPTTNVCNQCLTFSPDCNGVSNVSDQCTATPDNRCICSSNGNNPCDTANLAAQVCKPTVGCRQCLVDTDCPAAKFPAIPKGNPNSATVACNTGTNLCVQCTNDTHCANNASGNFACDTSKNVCVQCYQKDSYCVGIAGKPKCNPTTNVCNQCLTFAPDCNGVKAISDQCTATPDNRCICSNNANNACDPANLAAQVCKPTVGCKQCLADADCPALKFPAIPKGNPNSATVACNTGTNLCVQCTNDTHCANNANGNFACDTSKNVCVQCYQDDKYCTGQATNKRCNPTTNVCVQCNNFNAVDCSVAISDQCMPTPDNRCICTNNGNQACNPNNLAGQTCKANAGCVQCLTDNNCGIAKFPGIPIGKPGTTFLACDTATNLCGQCTNDSYCAGTTKPACLTPNDVCVQCTASNKTACVGTTQQCRLDSNACVQCLTFAAHCDPNNSDACSATNSCTCKGGAQCAGGTPVCDTRAGSALSCVQCTPTQKGQCNGGTAACNPVDGKCVQCIDRTTCSAPTPGCDTSTNKCVQCTGNADCNGVVPGKPLCDTVAASANLYKCVECLSASDCGTRGDVCDAGVCKCRGGSGMNQNSCAAPTPVCNINPTANACVECNSDPDCKDPLKPACEKSTGKCTQCTASNKTKCAGTATPSCNAATNLCVQCGADDSTKCLGDLSKCNLGTRQCVECLDVADCGTRADACAANVCTCKGNTDCVVGSGKPLCNKNATAEICVECNEDTDCKDALKPACNKTTGVCGQCSLTKKDLCTGTTKPSCDTTSNLCVQCGNDDATQCVGALPKCNTTTRACVECLAPADCGARADQCVGDVCKCKGGSAQSNNSCVAPTALCNKNVALSQLACVECNEDTDCKDALKPACNKTTGVCGQCSLTKKDLCTGTTKPSCDTTSNLCVECGTDDKTKCVGTKAECDLSGRVCVECNAPADCKRRGDGCVGKVCKCKNQTECDGTTQFCDTNGNAGLTCVECTADSDCKDAAKPACNKTTGVCGQCSLTKKDLCTGTTKPSCDTTSNLCVQCGADDKTQCVAPKAECNLTSRACVECLVGTDCGRRGDGCDATSTCTCKGAAQCNAATLFCDTNNPGNAALTCVECTLDADCKDAAKPACNKTTGACVECTSTKKTKCAGATPSCNETTNLCVECGADDKTQCVGAKPACNTTTRACVACVAPADCGRRGDGCDATNACTCKTQTGCDGATKFCDTNNPGDANLTCVECTLDTDCKDAAKPACNKTTGVCVECTSTKKTKCAGATPSCNDTTNLCVQCGLDDKTQCVAPKAACDLASRSCVDCLLAMDCGTRGDTCTAMTCQCQGGGMAPDTACKDATPLCNKNATPNVCVECNADADCAGKNGKTACNMTTGVCVECTTANPALCIGAKPVCNNATNLCVQCLAPADCSTRGDTCTANTCECKGSAAAAEPACTGAAPVCNTNLMDNTLACVECNSDGDCKDANKPACNKATGACVQCTAANKTKCGGLLPACDTTAGQFKCVECNLDSECPTRGDTCSNMHVCQCKGGAMAAGASCAGAKPLCNTNVALSALACVECNGDSDCKTMAKPACEKTTGTCVACTGLNQTLCMTIPATPVCEPTTNACVACVSDSSCTTVAKPACNTVNTADVCVECTANSYCSFNSKGGKCGANTANVCGCDNDNQCNNGSGGKCLNTGLCGCTANPQCSTNPNGPSCNGGVCTCSSSGDCAGYDFGTLCKMGANRTCGCSNATHCTASNQGTSCIGTVNRCGCTSNTLAGNTLSAQCTTSKLGLYCDIANRSCGCSSNDLANGAQSTECLGNTVGLSCITATRRCGCNDNADCASNDCDTAKHVCK